MTAVDIVDFMSSRGLFKGWDRKIALEHIYRRLLERSIYVVAQGENIDGVFIYRRFSRLTEDIDNLSWGHGDKRGLFVYISEIAISTRAAIETIASWFKEDNPDWASLKYYAYRRGKIRNYNLIDLERITERLTHGES